jgi:hypothetical protein
MTATPTTAAPNKAAFPAIFATAEAAGAAAAAAFKAAGQVQPMTVTDGKQNWFIADGPCGFAWVRFRDGRSPFAKWVKSTGKGYNGYPTGVEVWIRAYGQSIQMKEVHAAAMAASFTAQGIPASYNSRMD